MDQNTINKAFENIAIARQEVYDASEKVAEARVNLDEKRIEVYSAGLIDGKNETDRKAQYAEHCMAEDDAVNCAEKALRLAQLRYDRASFEVSRVKTLISWIGIEIVPL
jgi:hypothetical protein